ncbi:glycerate kinase [Paenibacillus sp. GP183]|uniref:glycerate kinase family protein n=1 Tax=Paenibacillus sp. GP183 TaxID=1882751 RepID=UPI00089C04DE|nr:glycerate kinase [Paenibacillus sp. GP183]SEB71337.1 glycerate kinase [Paenibacillus sp. GP183]
MKFVLAPDSYKGSLTAIEACDAMEEGIRRVIPHAAIIKVPMADGGEGTVRSLVDAMNGHLVQATVKNPLGEPVLARYGILQDQETAVIEMAEASGLYLIDANRRNPLLTTTYGTGELILDALNRGCRKFILCIGGSSTNDGGAGMAQALGAKLVDAAGEDLPFGGGSLNRLHRIDVTGLDPRIKESSFTVACDVDNPLCGVRGASNVFGPQKGATAEMIAILDQNLEHYAHLIDEQLGKSVRDLPGAGAAGGLGAGITAFLEGSLKKGIELVIEATRLEEKISGADLVLSGEGQSDFQTKFGKTPFGVAKAASKSAVPVVLISGSIGKGIEELYEHGVTSVFSMIDRPMPLEDAMTNARQLLTNMTERVIRLKFSSLTRTIY